MMFITKTTPKPVSPTNVYDKGEEETVHESLSSIDLDCFADFGRKDVAQSERAKPPSGSRFNGMTKQKSARFLSPKSVVDGLWKPSSARSKSEEPTSPKANSSTPSAPALVSPTSNPANKQSTPIRSPPLRARSLDDSYVGPIMEKRQRTRPGKAPTAIPPPPPPPPSLPTGSNHARALASPRTRCSPRLAALKSTSSFPRTGLPITSRRNMLTRTMSTSNVRLGERPPLNKQVSERFSSRKALKDIFSDYDKIVEGTQTVVESSVELELETGW